MIMEIRDSKYNREHYQRYKKYYGEYYQTHKEKIKKYKESRKEELKKYSIEYKYKNKKRIRAKRQKKRKLVIEHYGGKCVCCGEKRIEFLAIDHINNDGNEHRKKLTTKIFYWLIKNNYPDGFQILCHNCNSSKAYYGYCPHWAGTKL